jgi:hypothetical protein
MITIVIDTRLLELPRYNPEEARWTWELNTQIENFLQTLAAMLPPGVMTLDTCRLVLSAEKAGERPQVLESVREEIHPYLAKLTASSVLSLAQLPVTGLDEPCLFLTNSRANADYYENKRLGKAILFSESYSLVPEDILQLKSILQTTFAWDLILNLNLDEALWYDVEVYQSINTPLMAQVHDLIDQFREQATHSGRQVQDRLAEAVPWIEVVRNHLHDVCMDAFPHHLDRKVKRALRCDLQLLCQTVQSTDKDQLQKEMLRLLSVWRGTLEFYVTSASFEELVQLRTYTQRLDELQDYIGLYRDDYLETVFSEQELQTEPEIDSQKKGIFSGIVALVYHKPQHHEKKASPDLWCSHSIRLLAPGDYPADTLRQAQEYCRKILVSERENVEHNRGYSKKQAISRLDQGNLLTASMDGETQIDSDRDDLSYSQRYPYKRSY